jgi:hypothetical protein
VRDAGFILEPTASDASFQNGLAECPNRTPADMMRSLLYCVNLGPEYWLWAILHAMYLKNRLPNKSTKTTPLQAYTGTKPNNKNVRVFGCPVVARLPGWRPAKLDSHTSTGIFLGYTATSHNVYYQDNVTTRIKIATHIAFDETGYSLPPDKRSIFQLQLQISSSTCRCRRWRLGIVRKKTTSLE